MSDETTPTFEASEPVLDTTGSLQIEPYSRRKLDVDVVRVTEENIQLAARWCGGEILVHDDGRRYVKVPAWRPLNAKQTMAFIGDRILRADTGFKVYVEKAFQASFEPRKEKA